MSSFWRNYNHWLHWKLSFWQLPVQPVMKISSKWRHFRFSGRAWMSNYIPVASFTNMAWWRHQMEPFATLLVLCAGNSPVTGEFPAQRPATWSFDVFFDLSLNKRLSKQLLGWWFETPSCSLWRHCNEFYPVLNVNVCTVEVCEWKRNIISRFIMDVITYTFLN